MFLALWGVPGEARQKKAAWLKQLTEGYVFKTQQQVETLQSGASLVGRRAGAPRRIKAADWRR